MRAILETVKKVAASPTANVLILGESGTGKELLARAIHEYGRHADQPFVEINCSALPETLIETELFGYEPGAFTDAKRTKKGLLELADGGTFFMDEIGDLNLRLQVKLVKALEEKTFRRIGGTNNIRVTMRIIAATNKNLVELIQTGQFREDLYYRLNIVTIQPPPLRRRGDDVLVLAEHFLHALNQQHNRNVHAFTNDAKDLLLAYPWPGNVRELKNSIERAILLGVSDKITADDLELGAGHIVENHVMQVKNVESLQLEIPPEGISLTELEKVAIEKALQKTRGNLSHAARLLKVSRETLRYRVKKHQLV
ncbi:sigma-54 dependent transcriptional regulator [bacterium]|nr:sigma-54 dependent transcriptional regulator [bacterium]